MTTKSTIAAVASTVDRVVTRTVTETVREPVITLTLPRDAAVTLKSIVGRVGGGVIAYKTTDRRQQVNDIHQALADAGILYPEGLGRVSGELTVDPTAK